MTESSQQKTISSIEYKVDSPALARLISYPHYAEEDYLAKMSELRILGVDSITVGNGRSTIGGISIAGKGGVGLVFEARQGVRRVALKVRRTDADRPSMGKEAGLQQIANSTGVGPKCLANTGNIIMMEYLDGMSIGRWVQGIVPSGFFGVARSILDQCRALDAIGLDHGELSRIGRHVIVSAKDYPTIVDFESASTTRRTSNVTSAVQSLFLHGSVALHSMKFTNPDKNKIVDALRNYKRKASEESYKSVLDSLGITF